MNPSRYSAAPIYSTNGLYVDTFIQDQSTKVVDFYFKRLLGTTTLSSNTSNGDYIINLTAGHGVTSGEYLSLLENNSASQFKVLNVSTNAITLDSPIDYPYTTAAEVRRTTTAMNVNGSSTPIIFDIKPSFRNKWHINNIVIVIEDGTEMDSAKFGGISALTKGICIRRVNGLNDNISNIKSNGEFKARGFTVSYDEKAPSGSYGICASKHFNSQAGNGVTIYLDGSTEDALQIIIQDDLTGLSKFTATAQGHYVQD